MEKSARPFFTGRTSGTGSAAGTRREPVPRTVAVAIAVDDRSYWFSRRLVIFRDRPDCAQGNEARWGSDRSDSKALYRDRGKGNAPKSAEIRSKYSRAGTEDRENSRRRGWENGGRGKSEEGGWAAATTRSTRKGSRVKVGASFRISPQPLCIEPIKPISAGLLEYYAFTQLRLPCSGEKEPRVEGAAGPLGGSGSLPVILTVYIYERGRR